MNTNIWATADHHFRHKNMTESFTRDDGTPARYPFKTVEECDEHMVACHNALVWPDDHFWAMGDFAMHNSALQAFGPRLAGHKRLYLGNHDLCRTNQYIKAGFSEIRATRYSDGVIFSHYPIHPSSLNEKKWRNVHGHYHHRVVYQQGSKVPDSRYLCISVEHTNYAPIPLDVLTDRKTTQQTIHEWFPKNAHRYGAEHLIRDFPY